MTMSPAKWLIPRAALRLITASMIIFPLHLIAAEDRIPRKYKKCNFHRAACTANLPQTTVTLDIQPKPVKTMRTLTFVLNISGTLPASLPYIDLRMPGMDMGPNRVRMKGAGKGQYQGQGIVVRCPSGKRVWCAEVTLPGVGVAEFVFDVIY